MNLLLDTHVLLWWLGESKQLSKKARALIADTENAVFISAVSVWELRIKEQLKKVHLPRNFAAILKDEAFEELSLSIAHAHALALLPMHHRDPFDRMLIAQARTDQLTFVTHDDIVVRYGVSHVLV